MKLWLPPTFPLTLHGNVKEEMVGKRGVWDWEGFGGADFVTNTNTKSPSQGSPNWRYPPPCRSVDYLGIILQVYCAIFLYYISGFLDRET